MKADKICDKVINLQCRNIRIKFFTACCSGPGSDRTPLRLNKVKSAVPFTQTKIIFKVYFSLLFLSKMCILSFRKMKNNEILHSCCFLAFQSHVTSLLKCNMAHCYTKLLIYFMNTTDGSVIKTFRDKSRKGEGVHVARYDFE